ncbi:MerR family transcriptional regulator [Hyphococcus sp.]|uniref:MerR family transcriptional regulator n=1 Tax=Hyphococcus sp. TaxID=2038636 RepID=UPI003CCB8A68
MSVAKSADAFRTISEAARELDVPQHVLRHWEEVFGQVRPMRRAGGRRYYRPLDIDLLRGIRVLLYDQRYTTKGVQKIFKDEGVKYVSELGRRAAAGESIDVRPIIDDEDAPAPAEEDVLELGADAAVKSASLAPEIRRTLKALLSRLETVQDALDEATLALEAIDADDDGRMPQKAHGAAAE